MPMVQQAGQLVDVEGRVVGGEQCVVARCPLLLGQSVAGVEGQLELPPVGPGFDGLAEPDQDRSRSGLSIGAARGEQPPQPWMGPR